MREWLDKLFAGRQGMDELSKYMFWCGAALIALAAVVSMVLSVGLGGVLMWFGLLLLIMAFVRAFSRRLAQREAENGMFLAWRQKKEREKDARRERFSQRKDFVFFKCPGCGTMIRVPRGKGKIHITCRCGYQLYRKT